MRHYVFTSIIEELDTHRLRRATIGQRDTDGPHAPSCNAAAWACDATRTRPRASEANPRQLALFLMSVREGFGNAVVKIVDFFAISLRLTDSVGEDEWMEDHAARTSQT